MITIFGCATADIVVMGRQLTHRQRGVFIATRGVGIATRQTVLSIRPRTHNKAAPKVGRCPSVDNPTIAESPTGRHRIHRTRPHDNTAERYGAESRERAGCQRGDCHRSKFGGVSLDLARHRERRTGSGRGVDGHATAGIDQKLVIPCAHLVIVLAVTPNEAAQVPRLGPPPRGEREISRCITPRTTRNSGRLAGGKVAATAANGGLGT